LRVSGEFLGVFFEERDLIEQFGNQYRRYRAEVGMLLPRPARKRIEQVEATRPRSMS
jgi:hypothetical protein